MNAMKTKKEEKKEIHTNERYKKSNQIYKIQLVFNDSKQKGIQ